jgi:serine phosphatase RsbU (regulator of sigma subunit)
MRKKIILCCVFVIGGFVAFSQQATDDKTRAVRICEFIRQITWKNDASLKSVTVGVLGDSGKLSEDIRKRAGEVGKIRNKSIVVLPLDELSDLSALQVIYINVQRSPWVKVDSLVKEISGKNILLVTEDGKFRESMINFLIDKDGKMCYELNEAYLKREGFTYSSLLSSLAVKTQTDWEGLFRKTRKALVEEKETTSRQKEEIEQQETEIAQQKTEITEQQEQINHQQARLSGLASEIAAKQKELQKQRDAVAQQEQLIVEKQAEIEKQSGINATYSEEIELKKNQIGDLNGQINVHLEQLHAQNVIITMGGLLVVFLLGFGIYVFINFKQKQRINKALEAKNEEIQAQNEEIQAQNDEITCQRDRIALQNKEITDSIIYAQRIQRAVLPTTDMMSNLDIFIFYRPRNIVSGDFYWMSQKDDKLIIVAADCTGHGVPGAFMSMLGVAFLNEIVTSETDVYANNILNRLRANIIRSLKQTGKTNIEESKDGMDIALCIIDYPSMTLQYAGAYNPLILIRDNTLQEIKADKMPVAYFADGKETFTNHLIPLLSGDCLYMFSDGYADQFGGPDKKKFSSKRLKESLLSGHSLPMKEQEKKMAAMYDEWRGITEQVDDVLLMGIKI